MILEVFHSLWWNFMNEGGFWSGGLLLWAPSFTYCGLNIIVETRISDRFHSVLSQLLHIHLLQIRSDLINLLCPGWNGICSWWSNKQTSHISVQKTFLSNSIYLDFDLLPFLFFFSPRMLFPLLSSFVRVSSWFQNQSITFYLQLISQALYSVIS